MIAASVVCTLIAIACLGAAAAIVVNRSWWLQYRTFGYILIAIAIVLMAISAWGLTLPNADTPAN